MRLLALAAAVAVSAAPAFAQDGAAPSYTIVSAEVRDSIRSDPDLVGPEAQLGAAPAGMRFVAVQLYSSAAGTAAVGDFEVRAPDGTTFPAIGAGPFLLDFVSDVRALENPAIELSGTGGGEIWLVFEVPAPTAPLTDYQLVVGGTLPFPLPAAPQ